jgi:Flp pilus assembly protein TadG
MKHRVGSTIARHSRPRGQSLVEFAVMLPVLLILVLSAVDLGRAFLSFITLNNATRIAANFAAQHPEGNYGDASDPVNIEYEAIVSRDTDRAFCTVSSLADPVYTDGPDSGTGDSTRNVGDLVRVDQSCVFRPLTPIISGIVGTSLVMNASTEFDVRAGQVIGAPEPVFVSPPTPSPSPSPGASPSPSPSPSICPSGQLLVPDFLGPPPNTVAEARNEWQAAGFSGTFSPNGHNGKKVLGQSLPGGSCAPSNSSMTVSHS